MIKVVNVKSIDCAKILLNAGAHVNRKSSTGINALRIQCPKITNKKLEMVLFAAGETLDETQVTRIPENLKHTDIKLCLKHVP